MEKDFDVWNEEKKKVNLIHPPHFRERDIWWCVFGLNVAVEIDGKGRDYTRPAVIIRKVNRFGCYVIPLTTSMKKELAFSMPIGLVAGKQAYANITQLRSISSKRLNERIGTLDMEVFSIMKKSAQEYIFPADSSISPLKIEGQPEGDSISLANE